MKEEIETIKLAEKLAANILMSNTVYTVELTRAIEHTINWEFDNRLHKILKCDFNGLRAGFYHEDSENDYDFLLMDLIRDNYKGEKAILESIKHQLLIMLPVIDEMIKEA